MSSITNITGKIYTVRGKLYVLSENISLKKEKSLNVFEEMLIEENEKNKSSGKPIKKHEEENLEEQKILEKVAPEPKKWRQEGEICEMAISLNLVLNIYVLQILMEDKETPSENFARFNFYIDYDLNFRYRNIAELSIPLKESEKESALPSEAAKLPTKYVFHWKSSIDPEAEYELVVLL